MWWGGAREVVVCAFGILLFPIGLLGQMWCLIVSIPDLCPLSYFEIVDGQLKSMNCPSFVLPAHTTRIHLLGFHCKSF